MWFLWVWCISGFSFVLMRNLWVYVCMSEHMPDLKLHWCGHYWLINIERRLPSFIAFAICYAETWPSIKLKSLTAPTLCCPLHCIGSTVVLSVMTTKIILVIFAEQFFHLDFLRREEYCGRAGGDSSEVGSVRSRSSSVTTNVVDLRTKLPTTKLSSGWRRRICIWQIFKQIVTRNNDTGPVAHFVVS